MSTSTNLFIDVEVAPEAASDAAVAAKLAEVCPVDIFAVGEAGELQIVEENLMYDLVTFMKQLGLA